MTGVIMDVGNMDVGNIVGNGVKLGVGVFESVEGGDGYGVNAPKSIVGTGAVGEALGSGVYGAGVDVKELPAGLGVIPSPPEKA
jgi:hypothetical protein